MSTRDSSRKHSAVRERVWARLATGFGLLITLMILLSGYGIKTLFDTTRVLDRLSEHEWKTVQLASELKSLVEANGLRITASARLGSNEYAAQLLAEYDAAKKAMVAVNNTLQQTIEGGDLKTAYDALASKNVKLDGIVEQVRKLQADSDFVSLETLLQGDLNTVNKDYTSAVNA